MKKTLVALAVLAVSGAAFAQSSVSLTGKVRFAYGTATAAAAANGLRAKTTGIGVTDGDWNIAVVEDLGGGLRAGANMSLRLRGRDAANDALAGNSLTDGNGARPRDSSMYVTGGFGTVTLGAVEAANGILPLVTAGGPTYMGLDNGAQLAGGSNVDLLGYTSPNISGFTFRVQKVDAVGDGGAQAASTQPDATVLGVSYAAGPLSVSADLTNYSANAYTVAAAIAMYAPTGTTAAASAAVQGGLTLVGIPDSRTRISANYNLGVARIGAGMQVAKNVAGGKKTEQAISVSAPFGPLLVGAVYATSKNTGTGIAGFTGSNTGYDLAVQYNLSRRTYVALQSRSTKGAKGVAATAPTSATNTRVQLAHSF